MIFQVTAGTKQIVEQRKPSFMARLGTAISVVVLVGAGAARVQDLEPRAYVDTPVGMNFLIASYAYSEGGVSTDASLPIQDAELTQNSFVLAYARSLNVFGKSGKIDLILPFSQLSGSALNKHNSIKLYVSTGLSTRTGSNFTTGGIAWQYRWGGGL